MKQGYKGYRSGCCCPFEVWGFSIDAPNLWPALEALADGSYGDFLYYLNGADPSDAIKPNVGNNATATSWSVSAAKVPSSYPYSSCGKKPPMSSADPAVNCEDAWEVDLGPIATRSEYANGGEDPGTHYTYDQVGVVWSSRAICIDSEQRFIVYALTPDIRTNFTTMTTEEKKAYFGMAARVKDHFQVDVSGVASPTRIQAQWRGANINDLGTPLMDYIWAGGTMMGSPGSGYTDDHSANLTGDSANSVSPPAQTVYYGKEYYVTTTYSPGSLNWSVGRLKYDDLSVYVTAEAPTGVADKVGDYAVALPSVRAFLTTAADQPDEPWVAALDDPGDPRKIVTGRWLSSLMRGTDPDPDLDYGDGSLQEAEVENVIVDDADRPDDYPDDEVSSVAIRCYNHINGKDYLVWTTAGDVTTYTPLATFETDLDTGLPDGMHFVAGGSLDGNTWIRDNGQAHGGSFAAKGNINAVFLGQSDLSFTANFTAADYLTFWYLHDNRYAGERVLIFTELTNFADPGNTLEVFIDGGHVPIEISNDGITFDPYDASVIDNIDVPSGNPFNDEGFYLTWRQARIMVPAGLHTIRVSLFRRFDDDGGNLNAYVDDIQFPALTSSSDPDGKVPWYYDGTQVRKVTKWAYAKRHDENGDGFYSRTSAVPDFITADFDGNIYYGNPHYIVKILPDGVTVDEDFGKEGLIAFTASPNIPEPQGYDDGNCEWVSALFGGSFDSVGDPPWGRFQILPTKCGLQVRGANGNIRDATFNPLPTADYPNDTFVRSLNYAPVSSNYYQVRASWNVRIHGWTICDNGKALVPHLEVLWSPLHYLPAFPVGPPYDTPPFWEYIEANGTVIYDDGQQAKAMWDRVRDPRQLSEGSLKSRWNRFHKIVSRSYCDTLSRDPQFVWMQNPADDPPETINEGMDPNPDYTIYPWPRGQYVCIAAYHCPSGYALTGRYRAGPWGDPCPDEGDKIFVWDVFPGMGGIADFDAVYESCTSCQCCGDSNVERRNKSG